MTKGSGLRVQLGISVTGRKFQDSSSGERGDKEVKSRDTRGVDAAGTKVFNVVSLLVKVGVDIFRRKG